MILSMSGQAITFLHLVLAGAVASLCYDLIRTLRRVIRHSLWLVQVEDTLFWLLFTLFVMLAMLWENNAQLRLFSLLAPLIGAVLYFCILSPFVMRFFVFIALFCKRIVLITTRVILHIFTLPFVIFGRLLSVPINLIKKILYKFNKIIKKLLKNLLKCATINNVSKVVLKFKNACNADGSDKSDGAGQENKTK